mgnify:CR=1 FL=1
MEHSFDVKIASEYGIHEAIILKHIYFWYKKNKANNQNYYDGTYWSYNSYSAFSEFFEYLNARQIKYAIKKIEDNGLIMIGNYNKNSFDKTNWYSMTEKGIALVEKSSVGATKSFADETKLFADETKLSDENGQNCPTNTIYKPDINTDINTDIKKGTSLSKESSVPKEKIDYKKIVNLFNQICKSYPKVTKISAKRKGHIRARLNDYSIEDLTVVFENMENSDFLKGKNNRNWLATFDWVIGSENNMAKVFEGNYKNKNDRCCKEDGTVDEEWEELWNWQSKGV